MSNIALVIIDLQNDFVAGGSLGCQNSLEIIPKLNNLINSREWGKIILTRDWHPKEHCSFFSNYTGEGGALFKEVHLECNGTQQILWPDHCVQGSFGAEFHKDLDQSKVSTVISKGTNNMQESYSAFKTKGENTGMEKYLEENGIDTVVTVGLAFDYCVGSTALDACKFGMKTYFVEELTGFVDPSTVEQMRKNLIEAKVEFITAEKCLHI